MALRAAGNPSKLVESKRTFWHNFWAWSTNLLRGLACILRISFLVARGSGTAVLTPVFVCLHPSLPSSLAAGGKERVGGGGAREKQNTKRFKHASNHKKK